MKARNATPGPGSYLLPSDFGYLDANKYVRGSTAQRTRMARRLQLSTMTKDHLARDHMTISDFETDRTMNKSANAYYGTQKFS